MVSSTEEKLFRVTNLTLIPVSHAWKVYSILKVIMCVLVVFVICVVCILNTIIATCSSFILAVHQKN